MSDVITFEDLHLASMVGIDDITCEDLHHASIAGMDDITYDDLTFEDLKPDVCGNMVLGMLI